VAPAHGKLEALKAAAVGSVAGSRAAGTVEEDLWLCAIEDRRRQGSLRARLFWFSGTLSFDVFELVSKRTKDLRLFFL
jgi:hypothetical protein